MHAVSACVLGSAQTMCLRTDVFNLLISLVYVHIY